MRLIIGDTTSKCVARARRYMHAAIRLRRVGEREPYLRYRALAHMQLRAARYLAGEPSAKERHARSERLAIIREIIAAHRAGL